MKNIIEIWEKGLLLNSTESDDGILSLEEISKKIKELELKVK